MKQTARISVIVVIGALLSAFSAIRGEAAAPCADKFQQAESNMTAGMHGSAEKQAKKLKKATEAYHDCLEKHKKADTVNCDAIFHKGVQTVSAQKQMPVETKVANYNGVLAAYQHCKQGKAARANAVLNYVLSNIDKH